MNLNPGPAARNSIPGFDSTIDAIARRARAPRTGRAALVAISGIDGAGKSTIATAVAIGLEKRGLRTALVPLDPWHEPMPVRFSDVNPAEHFYLRAFRWSDLFDTLIDPLARHGSIRMIARHIRLRDDGIYDHTYDFTDVGVVVLEGIFLFKRELRARYDAALWVECSFERALERALIRNQEGLPRERLIADYQRIYFPAQRLHFTLDDPKGFAGHLLPE